MNTSKLDSSIGTIPKTPAKGVESRARCLVVQKEGNTNYYRPAVDEGQALEEEIRQFLDRVVGPEILSGTPVFVGTRVPFRSRIDYLERGSTLAEFLDDFPTVTREQAVAALEEAGEALVADARSA